MYPCTVGKLVQKELNKEIVGDFIPVFSTLA
jgi:hypothetical protein